MTAIDIAIIGANHQSLFDLVSHFQQSNPKLHFSLFGVSGPITMVPDNATYHEFTNLESAVAAGLKQLAAGQSQVLFKGIIQTHTLLKAVLNPDYQLKEQQVLSHVARLSLPGYPRPILLSDAAMNITPDEHTLPAIVNNAVETAQAMGISQPKVALLSAAENFNPKMPSSVVAQQTTDYFKAQPLDATIFGPISLDLALSPHSVQTKKFSGPIAGDADILIVPSIDVGNVLYKALMLFTQVKVGGLIIGAKVPIVLTSRSDRLGNKIAALDFALSVIN